MDWKDVTDDSVGRAVEARKARTESLMEGSFDLSIKLSETLQVEHNIQPPLRSAITLPLLVGDRRYGVCVYVAVTGFGPAIEDEALLGLARLILRRVNENG